MEKTMALKHSSQGMYFCLENVYECSSHFCDICLACGIEPESNLHIFVKCEVAKGVWRCWLDSLANLLNVNMNIIDITVEIFESSTSSDL